VADTAGAVEWLEHRLGGVATLVDRTSLRDRIVGLAADVDARLQGGERPPTLVVLYGADAVDTLLDRGGTEALKKLLHFGPEVGVHVLGWWRSVQRLRSVLTVPAAADDIGCWVALDVQGGELNPLTPGLLVAWSPRPGRGLFYDRAQHARPVTVIVPALERAPEERP
jgi:DNA segregation ATPase FtsK/SpoIIIE, S-DNA-T family